MKINKILAAGVAATLAVTSLASVVSAEKQTREFEIWINKSSYTAQTKTIPAEVNRDIADNLMQSYVQVLTFEDLNANVGAWKTAAGNNTGNYVDAITLKVSGFSGTTKVDKEFTLKNGAKEDNIKTLPANVQANVKNKWFIVVLDKKTPVYHEGEFASFYFDRITDMSISLTIKGNDTTVEDIHKHWNNTGSDLDIGKIKITDFYNTDNSGHTFTFGTNATNKTVGTSGYSDLGWVESIQATERNTVIPATRGILVGSVVTANNVGNELTQAQGTFTAQSGILNTATGKIVAGKIKSYGKPAVATAALTGVVTAAANETAVTETAPIVINGKVYTQGYLYATASKDIIFVNRATKLTATEKATIDALAAGKLVSDVTAACADAIVILNEAAAASLVAPAAANMLPVAYEFDKTQYDLVTSADETKDAAADVKDENGDVAIAKANATKLGTKVFLQYKDGTYGYTEAASVQAFTGKTLSDTDSTAALLAYAFAKGGWYVSENRYFDGRTETIKGAPTTTKVYGWLPVTVKNVTNDHDGTATIRRNDVKVLSETYATASAGAAYGTTTTDGSTGSGQTYTDAMEKGTYPIGFAGLAGQVAEFFNKQNNGTITFTFTAAAAAGGNTAWQSGVPSTEVGLIGSGAGTITSNFALFFNYNSTGGMMLSPAKVDTTKGEVTFDITDYLNDSGTLTKATLHDIYYGLNVGAHQYNGTWGDWGLWVSKVALAYDDAPAADADAAAADDDATVVADDDDAAAVVDADDDDDDDTALIADDDDDDDDATIIADDDDDDTDDDDIAAVITDDDEDDTAAAGTVDVVTPAAQDSNPVTGVGLAVIPAIVAAAAMAISKKRK